MFATVFNATEIFLLEPPKATRGEMSLDLFYFLILSAVPFPLYPTLQRTNTENSKQILPEKELRGQSPNLHIHVSVSDLYIPTIDLPFLLQEICGPILGIYKSLTDTWMWKLGLRPCNFQERNT